MIHTETVTFSERAFEKRIAVLERARARSLNDIESAPLEEDLETAMAVAG
jgi:hypothetical protein